MKIDLNQKNDRIPMWFMRQAGRYLPEYRKVRQSVGSFLDLCYNPIKASEVTLQPLKRFDLDFAIIFSDILVLPHAHGWPVTFQEGEGPVLKQFSSKEDLNYLENNFSADNLKRVYEAINLTKANLPKNISLIGFAGAPWTLMSYMIEGRGKHDFSGCKKFIYENKDLSLKLTYLLAGSIARHLENQIKNGVDLIQIFDSWSGMLNGKEYDEFIIKPTKYIVSYIKNLYPKIKIIGFPKGSGFLYDRYIDQTGIDVIGFDQFVPVDKIKSYQEKKIVQGNLDPVTLLTNKEIIKEKVDEILIALSPNNFIFNLGHGMMPATKIENVEFLINYVRNYRKN